MYIYIPKVFLEIEVQTFSISRKATYLCMQCCRWEDLVTGRYTCNWGIQLPLVLAFCTDKMWHASSLLSDMKSRDIDAAHFAAVTNPVKNHYKRMLDYFVNCSANAAAEIFNVKIKAFRGAVIKIRLNLLWLLNYLFSIMYFLVATQLSQCLSADDVCSYSAFPNIVMMNEQFPVQKLFMK